MEIKTVQLSFADSSRNETITIVADIATDENVDYVINELRDELKNSGGASQNFYTRRNQLQSECDELIVKLIKLRREWNLTAEFLRVQGINPECPSMPVFDKLLFAARNEEEVTAEFEDENNDDYEEEEE
ncbi:MULTISPECIES: hypothetical protein [unclassified Nostoc]|uniref:hypothetical protein n=1 Tax=unclassified Nostoc TaxID=2593658 RepID=UPI002AD20DCF|nr:hypothetical protein [Nostoc sp. DedQUE03]MDZ7974734.1 hypothetical protein [Nostoc sp. DedQUE03]MDZ8048047.1 hypothetical protein [Nostoc sp. DedQUE02]